MVVLVLGLIGAASAEAAPSFSAHGSAEQVYVTGLAPNATMSLLTPQGTTLQHPAPDLSEHFSGTNEKWFTFNQRRPRRLTRSRHVQSLVRLP
jgi:hypothetical protein